MASTPLPTCYVRVREEHANGFVEFDFAIGDPELYVELILPRAAFDAFCAEHAVQRLDDAAAQRISDDKRQWRHGEPRR